MVDRLPFDLGGLCQQLLGQARSAGKSHAYLGHILGRASWFGHTILYSIGFAAKVDKVLVQRSLMRIIVCCLGYAQTKTSKYSAMKLTDRDNNGRRISRDALIACRLRRRHFEDVNY